MAITRTSFATTPYLFIGFSGFTANKNGAHTCFSEGPVRVSHTVTAGAPTPSTVSFSKAPGAGEMVYLSYFTDEISSVRLSSPPPTGVSLFATDNLSGCKVFIDRITGSADVIVYHANARMHSPASNQGAVHPARESAAATAHLDGLHAAAQLAYQNAGVPAVNGGSLNKPTYNANAEARVQRKANQGRTRISNPAEPPDPNRLNAPEFVGGTVVCGFWVSGGAGPGHWEFRYQTWGAIEYQRPRTAPKGWRHGRNVHAGDYEILQQGVIPY